MSAYCTGHCLFPPGSLKETCMHLDILQIKECSHSSTITGNHFSKHNGAKKKEHLKGKKPQRNPLPEIKMGHIFRDRKRKYFPLGFFWLYSLSPGLLAFGIFLSLPCQTDSVCWLQIKLPVCFLPYQAATAVIMAHRWISFIPTCLLDAAFSEETILRLHALCKASGLTSDDSFWMNWLPTSEMNKRV